MHILCIIRLIYGYKPYIMAYCDVWITKMSAKELDEFKRRVGAAIKKLRGEECVTAFALSRIIGLTQSTISRIESGRTSITVERLCLLAREFNRPLSYFIGEQSPLDYNERDIIQAALAEYGASHLKRKRTINVREHFGAYTDVLNAALAEADDARIAAAIISTLYVQASRGALKPAKIAADIINKRLIANFVTLASLLKDAGPKIKRPSSEKKRVLKLIDKIRDEIEKTGSAELHLSTVATVSSDYAADFINECI